MSPFFQQCYVDLPETKHDS